MHDHKQSWKIPATLWRPSMHRRRRSRTIGASVFMRGFLITALLARLFAGQPCAGGELLARALAGPLKDSSEVVFAVRMLLCDGHFYASYAPYPSSFWGGCEAKKDPRCDCDGLSKVMTAPASNAKKSFPTDVGGQLCRLNLRTGEVKVLFEDPAGSMRDVCIHYDGSKILFSYRPAGSWYFHLHEINADGSGLKQLTDGPHQDGECTYLPDGGIAFTSTRANRAVGCYGSHVHLMYRCEADGGSIRPLSAGTFGEHTPWVLPDGRIVYNRWDYTDRDAMDFHGLWAMRPDGTASVAFYGNSARIRSGHCFTDPRPVPGTEKLVCTYHPAHGVNKGRGVMALIDTTRGPDDPSAMRILVGDLNREPKDYDYSDPVPLGSGLFLVCHNRDLLLVDEQGGREVVFSLKTGEHNLAGPAWRDRIGKEELDFTRLVGYAAQHGTVFMPLVICEPMVMRSRPREPVIASSVDMTKDTGRVVLQNVYYGRNMEGIKPGGIQRILVIAELPMVRKISGFGPDGGSVWTLKEVVGCMKVENDGSAQADLPAMKNLQFIALDDQWRCVKRMHSFVNLQPGESVGCIGCHEERGKAALRPSSLLALRQPANLDQTISGRLDYAKVIQPIWDRHCVRCHNREKYAGQIDLTGDPAERNATTSYAYLRGRGLLPDKGHFITRGNDKPNSAIGSAAGSLNKYLLPQHHQVKVTDLELRTICHWMDCGALHACNFDAWGGSGRGGVLYDVTSKGLGACLNCHGMDKKTGKAAGPHLSTKSPLFNLARAEQSLLVLAPLTREQGGLGVCRMPDGKPATVFAQGKSDPLYQAALKQCTERAAKRDWWGAENYRLNKAYVLQMQRFGILPSDFDHSAQPPDPYLLDQRYFDSHWRPSPAVSLQSDADPVAGGGR